jgi:sec-independent protein translocase protein TatC
VEEDKKEFIGHLDELRAVIIKIILMVITATCISFFIAPVLFKIILLPLADLLKGSDTGLIKALSPAETFMVSVKIAFITGLIVSSPAIIYQAWCFVRPGLKTDERRSAGWVLFFSPVLFFTGMVFAYKVVLPLALKFLWDYTVRMGIEPSWTVGYYTGFSIMFLVAFGIAFELPVVVVFLTKLGLITPKTLISKRRHAILAIFILAAILTPPDVISQVLLGIPMMVLYEISIILAKLISKNK